jgi:hypothetical protein
MNFDIFISHNKKDSSIISRYIKLLLEIFLNSNSQVDPIMQITECNSSNQCHKIFFDSDYLHNLQSLINIIETCEKFIIILSPNYFKSEWCILELYYILKLNKSIIILYSFEITDKTITYTGNDITLVQNIPKLSTDTINTQLKVLQEIFNKKKEKRVIDNNIIICESEFESNKKAIICYYNSKLSLKYIFINIILICISFITTTEITNYYNENCELEKSQTDNYCDEEKDLDIKIKDPLNIIESKSEQKLKLKLKQKSEQKLKLKLKQKSKQKLKLNLKQKSEPQSENIKYIIIITDSTDSDSFLVGEIIKIISRYSNWKIKYNLIIKTINSNNKNIELSKSYLPIIFLLLSKNIINKEVINTITCINNKLKTVYNEDTIYYQGIDIKKNFEYMSKKDCTSMIQSVSITLEIDLILKFIVHVITFDFNVNTHFWLLKYQILSIIYKLYQLRII